MWCYIYKDFYNFDQPIHSATCVTLNYYYSKMSSNVHMDISSNSVLSLQSSSGMNVDETSSSQSYFEYELNSSSSSSVYTDETRSPSQTYFEYELNSSSSSAYTDETRSPSQSYFAYELNSSSSSVYTDETRSPFQSYFDNELNSSSSSAYTDETRSPSQSYFEYELNSSSYSIYTDETRSSSQSYFEYELNSSSSSVYTDDTNSSSQSSQPIRFVPRVDTISSFHHYSQFYHGNKLNSSFSSGNMNETRSSIQSPIDLTGRNSKTDTDKQSMFITSVDMGDSPELNTKVQLLMIKGNPAFYTGIPQDALELLMTFTSKCGVSERDILITLKKIRLNDTFERMAKDFGLSREDVKKIYTDSIGLIADCLRQLIFWPDMLKERLPILFKLHYNKVASVLDYLQVTPPTKLDESCSDEECCPTYKYLISWAPNGFINFVSSGFRNGETDMTILRNSAYLSEKDQDMTQGMEDNNHDMQALRKHIEASTNRLKEFHLLFPYSPIEVETFETLDAAVIIACAIVNIQKPAQ